MLGTMEVVCHEGEASDDEATVRVHSDSDSGHLQLRRFTILSDSPLSHLFELSAHLEAVAVAAAAKGAGAEREREVQSSSSKVDFCGGEGGTGSAGGQRRETTSTLNRYETSNANRRMTASRSSNANLEMKPQRPDDAFSSKGIDIILSPASRRHSVGSDLSNSSQAESTPFVEPMAKSSEREAMEARRESGSLDLVVKMATEAANAAARLSGRAGDSALSAPEALWQGRCVELEESLQKFRDQAQNIRELLREKLAELEQRVAEAESRAEDAEDKVRLMEKRVNHSEWSQNSSNEGSNHSLTIDCPGGGPPEEGDQEIIIKQLECEVEQQRQLRLSDAKQVEAKAARIKDWVTNKLRDLEEQNEHLKVQNERANAHMEILRQKLEQLQIDRDAAAAASSAAAAVTAAAAATAEASLVPVKAKALSDGEVKENVTSLLGNINDTTKAADVAAEGIDDAKRPIPPPRTRFPTPTPTPTPTLVRKTTADTAPRRRRPESADVIVDGSGVGAGAGGRDDIGSRRPRLKAAATAVAEGHGGLPDKHRSLHMPLAPIEGKKLSKKGAADLLGDQVTLPLAPLRKIMSDESHDYSEIFTPNGDDCSDGGEDQPDAASDYGAKEGDTGDTRTGSGDSGLTGLSSTGTAAEAAAVGAPAPPLHRYPSWEDRIYRVAREGLPQVGGGDDIVGEGGNARNSMCGGYGNDIVVPVYASVKGRAGQIRSMPFTGESSDSDNSDVEDDGGDTGRGTSNSSAASAAAAAATAGNMGVYDVTTAAKGGGVEVVPVFSAAAAVASSSHNRSATNSSTTSADLSLTSPRGGGTGGVVPVPIASPFKFSANTLTMINTNLGGGVCAAGAVTTSSGGSEHADISADYAVPPDASESHPRTIDASSSSLSSFRLSASHPVVFAESPRRTPATATAVAAEKALEKCGYLTKLGGKIKSWRKRYFVLKNGTLSYWKSQHDSHRKAQGIIVLDESCRVSRAEATNTFEIASRSETGAGGKTYYLTADSTSLMEEWVRVLQNVIQRNALKLLLSSEDQKPTASGWLSKVKNGHAKRVWCVLIGKMFIYFKTPGDQNPMGQINMRDTRVEEVCQISSDSDSDGAGNVESRKSDHNKGAEEPTVGIFPNHVQQGPTYLIFPGGKQEAADWLYHLTVVSGGNPSKVGTPFEQIVQRLMEEEGNPSSAAWRSPVTVRSKEPMTSPLTTFTTERLQEEALKLFKSILLFTSVVMDAAGIDYHVMLAANALQQCLDIPELQPELLSVLVKQTNRPSANGCNSQSAATATSNYKDLGGRGKHSGVQSFFMNASHLFTCDSSSAQKSSPPGCGGEVEAAQQSGQTPSLLEKQQQNQVDSKGNPANCVYVQAWMLMAMAVSIFVPKESRILWLLRTHFDRCKDSRTETGKYASYCGRALERAVANGGRQCRPSRMEVLSILLKNPHHHSLPHALPVHMMNDTYHVLGYDGSTTVREFDDQLGSVMAGHGVQQRGNSAAAVAAAAAVAPNRRTGFALMSDDPLAKDVEHALHPEDKVCDVISRWETALREKGQGRFENNRAIRFSYKSRMYWRRNVTSEGERERLLLAYQTSAQIREGQFPINKDLAFELAALMAQIHFGDLPSFATATGESEAPTATAQVAHMTTEAARRFFPVRYVADLSREEQKGCEASLAGKWGSLRGKSALDCVRIFLTCTRKWPFFGATLFDVQSELQTSTSTSVWLAVNEDGISVLDYSTMQPSHRFAYDSIVTFGGCQEDFMMVVITPPPATPSESERGVDGRRQRLSEESGGTLRILFRTKKPEILQITLLIADYMNMIGKTTAATGSAGSGRSSLFLSAPTSVMVTPKLPRCPSSGAGSTFESSRARRTAALFNSKPSEEEEGEEGEGEGEEEGAAAAATAKRQQVDSGVA